MRIYWPQRTVLKVKYVVLRVKAAVRFRLNVRVSDSVMAFSVQIREWEMSSLHSEMHFYSFCWSFLFSLSFK